MKRNQMDAFYYEAEEGIESEKITATVGPVLDNGKANHELRTQQSELEMQNKDLSNTQTQLEKSRQQYYDLYNNAPIADFTFDQKGNILDANLTAAKMLQKERSSLTKKHFNTFIAKEETDLFYLYLRIVFKSRTPQTCDIKLKGKNGRVSYVQLHGIAVQGPEGNTLCRVMATNITKRIREERVTKKSLMELKNKVERLNSVLAKTNKRLVRKSKRCELMEESMKKQAKELKYGKHELNKLNITVETIFEKTEEIRKEIELKTLSSVKELLLPHLEDLKVGILDQHLIKKLNVLESYINDIVSPFFCNLPSSYLNLTQTEIKVSSLIKVGKTTKDISRIMGLSVKTIDSYRKSIRKKHKITNKTVNLQTFLQSFHQ